MNNKKLLITTFALSAIALSSVTTSIFAEDSKQDKCMGLVKAGLGDGKTTVDGVVEEWLYVPAGACEKFVGGRLLIEKFINKE